MIPGRSAPAGSRLHAVQPGLIEDLDKSHYFT